METTNDRRFEASLLNSVRQFRYGRNITFKGYLNDLTYTLFYYYHYQCRDVEVWSQTSHETLECCSQAYKAGRVRVRKLSIVSLILKRNSNVYSNLIRRDLVFHDIPFPLGNGGAGDGPVRV